MDRSSVTIAEVAGLAGVSRQTVSNVLNAPERVAPGTAERVTAAIERLGYRPNKAARNLRARASRLVGFRINSPMGLGNLLDRFLHALADAARASGHHVLLFSPEEADEVAAYEDLIRTGTVDGFVLADIAAHDTRPARLAASGIPFVCFGRPWGHDHDEYAWVDVDGAHGTADAVDHLVARGHRRIGYLGWPEGTGFGDERKAGWLARVNHHGLDATGLAAACAQDAGEAGRAARAMTETADPPTAFVCGSDTYAVGVRLACGADVVGFDDSPAASLLTPPLSSLRQPLGDVAHHVVDLLLRKIKDPTTPPSGVLLRPELVRRDL
jgi:DNA-binding LacI/PurR family transcriptional regulator